MFSNLQIIKMEIINKELQLKVFGFSGVAVNKNYGATAFALMDKMWPIVKSKGIKHKGMNIWIYESDHRVFAGVELEDPTLKDTGLESKVISLSKYAYHKHIGSYSLLKQAGDNMRDELKARGLKHILPFIEIYGHWNDDETKVETELIMALE